MCEFKVGDEVVCIVSAAWHPDTYQPTIGGVYVVASVEIDRGRVGITLTVADPDDLFAPKNFRKVERRNWSEWLKTAEPSKYDKRKKVKA